LRISLVTPTYNQGRYIRRTIESVLSQQGDFELDYVVYDGVSTDETLDILKSYGERLRWHSERDGGQVDAINKGLRCAAGDVVGWLNSDDLLAPGALQRISEAFTANPKTEWAHGRCDIIDSDDRTIRGAIIAYKHRCCLNYSFENLVKQNFISQMTVFWRRKVLDEVGYIDEQLKLALDYDLWLRLAKRGAPIYIPEKQASFRWHEQTKSGSGFEAQFKEDMAVARRYASDRPWLLMRKRFKTFQIVTAYKLLRFLRKVSGKGAI